jgi:hypothetical protein
VGLCRQRNPVRASKEKECAEGGRVSHRFCFASGGTVGLTKFTGVRWQEGVIAQKGVVSMNATGLETVFTTLLRKCHLSVIHLTDDFRVQSRRCTKTRIASGAICVLPTKGTLSLMDLPAFSPNQLGWSGSLSQSQPAAFGQGLISLLVLEPIPKDLGWDRCHSAAGLSGAGESN